MSNRLSKAKSFMLDSNKTPAQIMTTFDSVGDAAAPYTSPFTYTTTTVGLTVPREAYEFICNPSTDIRISTIQDMSYYDVITATSKEALPCSDIDSIYVRGDSAGGTMNFRYHKL